MSKFFSIDKFRIGKLHEIDISLLPKSPKYDSRAITIAKIMTTFDGTSFAKENITISVDNIDRFVEGLMKAKAAALGTVPTVSA
jgi:hypothetical protein